MSSNLKKYLIASVRYEMLALQHNSCEEDAEATLEAFNALNTEDRDLANEIWKEVLNLETIYCVEGI